MFDRLQELLHQKALLAEHAEWLEHEIALERARTSEPSPAPGEAAPAAPSEPADPTIPVPGASAPAAAAVADTAGAIPDGYRPEPQSVRHEVTRGCLLYFVAGIVILGLGVAAIFWFYRHR